MIQLTQPPTASSLVDMLNRQKSIMEWFKVKEGLPDWPLDLTKRENQTLLKKFAYRTIEELGEAMEHLYFANAAVQTNHSEESYIGLEQYNMELADVWHFMLEIMVFSGLDYEGIKDWVRSFSQSTPKYAALLDENNLLAGFLKYAEFKNQEDGKPYRKDRFMYRVLSEQEAIDEPWNMGGRLLSEKVLEDHDQFAWHITYKLTTAMNQLKHRDWLTESEKTTNIIQYTQNLMDAFIGLVRMMSYTGKTELGIYNSYLIKNNILHANKEKNL